MKYIKALQFGIDVAVRKYTVQCQVRPYDMDARKWLPGWLIAVGFDEDDTFTFFPKIRQTEKHTTYRWLGFIFLREHVGVNK